MIRTVRHIARALINVAQVTGVCVLGASCSDNHMRSEPSAAASSSNLEPAKMKYEKTEPANSLGYAKVSLHIGDKYAEGVIDAKGVEVIPLNTDLLVADITDATALLQFANKFLFVDLDQGPVDTASFATTDGFQFAEPFRSGLALVTVNDEQFYINVNGERPLKETYDHAETFHSDRALVYNNNRKRIIDPKGHTVAELKYDQVSSYSASRWQVTRIKNEVYLSGFVDLDGKEVVSLVYDNVGMYQDDVKRTIVGIKGKLGFVDENGVVAIPLVYDYAEVFSKGKALVRLNGRLYFIDTTGKEVE